MFENLDSKKDNSHLQGVSSAPKESLKGMEGGSSAPKVEDMFADVKDVVAPASKTGGVASAMPKASPAGAVKSSGNALRNLIIIVIGLLILLAGVFLAARFVGPDELKNLGEQFSNLKGLIIKEDKPGTTIVIDNEPSAIPENNGNNNPAVNPPVENIPAYVEPNIPPGQSEETSTVPTPAIIEPATDTDGDGLLDSEEAVLGTNPLKADSDDDGLTDAQEVKTYLTDPNKADTDGDSYLDGAEVSAGYDPKGPGKLVN